MFFCSACKQPVVNAEAASRFGLSASNITGQALWHDKDILSRLPPKPLRLLREIILAGDDGVATKTLLRQLDPRTKASKAVHVHMTRLREWFNENCLPLDIVSTQGKYLLIERGARAL